MNSNKFKNAHANLHYLILMLLTIKNHSEPDHFHKKSKLTKTKRRPENCFKFEFSSNREFELDEHFLFYGCSGTKYQSFVGV